MNGFSRHVSRFWLGWLLVAAVVVLAIMTLRASTSTQREALVAVSDEPAPATQVHAKPGSSSARYPAQPAPSVDDPAREALEHALAMEHRRMEKGEKDQRYWQEGFAAQRVNPEWAPPKEREILQLVGSDKFKASNASPEGLEVECRSSLCRVTADFPSNVAAQDWTEFFTLYSASRFSGGLSRQETIAGGKARLTIITAARN
jgi:hypothetical protein